MKVRIVKATQADDGTWWVPIPTVFGWATIQSRQILGPWFLQWGDWGTYS